MRVRHSLQDRGAGCRRAGRTAPKLRQRVVPRACAVAAPCRREQLAWYARMHRAGRSDQCVARWFRAREISVPGSCALCGGLRLVHRMCYLVYNPNPMRLYVLFRSLAYVGNLAHHSHLCSPLVLALAA